MAGQSWYAPIVVQPVAGPAVSGTTETSLLDAACKSQLKGNWFTRGKTIRVVVEGQISNIVTTPGTITFRLKWGASIILAASQAIQLNTTAQTNTRFRLELLLTCRQDGTAANFMLEGYAMSVSFGTGAALGIVLIPASAPAVGANVDVTANQFIDLTAQFSLTGNSIQAMQIVIDDLNIGSG
jgi:hypothetical protein